MTARVVAKGFVREARSNTVSLWIGSDRDVNEQYPAMEISANVMRPSRNAIFSILNISINEFQQGEETLDHNMAFQLLIQAQNAWISTIAEYRLYLANRIGSFNEQGLR